MNTIIAAIFDREWWITVAVAGTIVGLFTAYLKDVIEVALSKAKDVLTISSKNRKIKKEKQIEHLVMNPYLIPHIVTHANQGMIKSVQVLLIIVLLPILRHVMLQHPDWTYGFKTGIEPMIFLKWIFPIIVFVFYMSIFAFFQNISIARRASKEIENRANQSVLTTPEAAPPAS